MDYVAYSKELGKRDVKTVGGKAANIAEMLNAGFPVPEAFFITIEAYEKFLKENNIRDRILEIIRGSDLKSPDSLREASKKIKELFLKAKMPQILSDAVTTSYKEMMYRDAKAAAKGLGMIKAGVEFPFVAVRSSAVTEDIEGISAAGQQETFLNVRGVSALLESVQKCWASLFTPRAIYYRERNKLSHGAGIGVIIQRMINSEKSGVMFTIDPATSEDKIVIEAVWGLGETIVQGEVNPDKYVISKKTGEIIEKKMGVKPIERIRDIVSGATVKVDVPAQKRESQVLSDTEIKGLAYYGKKIEDHYKSPQDIEFAVEKGKIYIVQSRAVTAKPKVEETGLQENVLLQGIGASPGIAFGVVKIVRRIEDLEKIERGDILVTEMTSPDYVPAMEKSAAIITDKGGTTAHAAIVSRELGVPCIVGTSKATHVLKDGDEITVDAHRGVVYAGKVSVSKKEEVSHLEKTRTKLKVNLAFAETAKKEVADKVSGIGLLRIEHMLTKQGTHPIEYIRRKKEDQYMKILVDNIKAIAKVFYPKPVWVRSLDARTDEFRRMKGGADEPKESNPMLGWHGIRRSLDQQDILKVEFKAIKKLHSLGLDNVAIMLPFVYDVSEIRKAKEIAKKAALPESVKIGVMIEVPSAALTIEDVCKEGVAFISFGSNDLTQLTLGMDRNNERLIKLFDEMHPSMRFLFKHVIETCKRYGVESSICGELPSNRKEAIDYLVSAGIDSISVNIDAIDKAKGWIAEAEKHK